MSDPADINDRLEAAAVKAEGASEILRKVANGPVGQYVDTESGQVPTYAEWLASLGGDLGGLPARIDDLESFEAISKDPVTPGSGSTIFGRSAVSLRGLLELQSAPRREDLIYLVHSFYAGSMVGGGLFRWEPDRLKTEHNGWRVIDPLISWDGTPGTLTAYLATGVAVGTGCFVRIFDGKATPEMAGALTDWNGTTGTNCSPSISALLADTEVAKITGSGGQYWFGNFTASEVKFVITRNVKIDWNWSRLICRGQGGLTDSSGALFVFEDCNTDMGYYIFDDLSFTFVIDGRGIMPVVIRSRNKSTAGHTLGPCHVERGQSILTIVPAGSVSNRISNVRNRGACTGNKVYYGLNCANAGDNVRFSYELDEVNRSVFVYGVSGVDVDFKARYSWPASASILIAQYAGSRATEKINIRGYFGEVNGPVLIADEIGTGGTGVYRDITVDMSFDTLGSNIPPSAPVVRMGCYEAGSILSTETKTVTTDGINIALRPGPTVPVLTVPIKVYTPSPNHGLWTLSESTPWEITSLFPANAAAEFNTPIYRKGGQTFKAVHGPLNVSTAKIRIPSRYLAPRRSNNEFSAILRVQARNGIGSTQALKISEYLIIGFIDSSGFLYLRNSVQISTADYSTPAATFTVAQSSDQLALEISCAGYTGALAALTASISWP